MNKYQLGYFLQPKQNSTKSKPICKNAFGFSQFQVRAPIKKFSFSNYEKKVSGHNQIQNFTA